MTALACLQALGVVAALGAGWLVLGFRLLRPVRAALAPAERLALALLGGAGAEAVALFVVGQVRFSPAVVMAAAAAALSPLLAPAERAALRESWRALPRPGRRASVAAAALALPALVLLLAALARPVGDIGHDGIAYHLLGPVVWLRQGRIVPALDMSHTAFPALVEVLFGAGMSLAGERAPGVVGLLLASAVVVQAAGLARWLGAGRTGAALTALLVATMPAVVDKVTIAFIDVEYAGFALAAVRLMFADAAGGAPFIAGALFVGLAMGTKYNGLTLAATTLPLAALCRWRRRPGEGRQAARLAALGALLGGLVALPFYLRNFLVLGVPIYPPPAALARLLPARAFPLAASVELERYIVDVRGRGFGRGLVDLLLLPIRFCYHTSNFHGAGGIGAVPLAFFPAGLALAASPEIVGATLWMVATTLVWFAVQQESRFLAPVVILSAAIAVVGAERLSARLGRPARAVLAVAVVVSVVYGGAVMARAYVPAALSVVDARRDQARWQRDVPYAEAFAFVDGLPADSRVLILSLYPPPYYLHRPYVKIAGLYGERPVDGVDGAPAALARSGALGITHVLDVRGGEGEPFEIALPPPAGLERVFDSPTARIYRVR